MPELITTVLRGALGFALLLLFTRVIGNKQLGQMNIFTYISGIAVGTMAGGMSIYHDIELFDSIVGIVLWGAATILLEKLTMKSRKSRRLLGGYPVIVIRNGVIDRDALVKERMNLDDLQMLLRSNSVFSVAEVQYAILEANGELSVLKKHRDNTPTRADLQLAVGDVDRYPAAVISDGVVVQRALRESGKTEQWLHGQLQALGAENEKQVLYAEIGPDGTLSAQLQKSG